MGLYQPSWTMYSTEPAVTLLLKTLLAEVSSYGGAGQLCRTARRLVGAVDHQLVKLLLYSCVMFEVRELELAPAVWACATLYVALLCVEPSVHTALR